MNPVLLTIIIVLSSLLFIYIVLWLFGVFIIHKFFKRMDLENSPELFTYDDVKDKYDRKEFSFKSFGKVLKGYIYGLNIDKIIVYVHGMCPGHCGYLSDIMALVDRGYKVITYDYTATGSSEGKYFYGISQQKYDLKALFKCLNNTEYKDSKVYLYGHSMGGYAVGCSCGKYKNVEKIVSISGFDNPYRFLVSVINKNDSLLSRITFTPLRIAFFMHFGIHSNEKASKNISKSDGKILIIHGSNDEIVNIKYSILNKKNEIKNKNAEYILMEDEYHNRHNTVIASTDCVKYQMKLEEVFNEEFAKTNDKYKARMKMLEGIDKFKFNVANDDLMNIIDEYYKK